MKQHMYLSRRHIFYKGMVEMENYQSLRGERQETRSLNGRNSASIWRERPRIKKIPDSRIIDTFLDKVADFDSVELSKPFDVATLNRRREFNLSSKHPMGFGGPVTLLSSTPFGGVFGESRLPAKKLAYAVDYESDLAEIGDLPEGHDYVIEDEMFHPYRGVTRPRTTTRERPASMYKSESNGDLLTPAERLINKEHIKRTLMAQNEFRKSFAAKNRRFHIINKMYSNGIVGIDSPDNEESPIYKNGSQILKNQHAKTAAARLSRSTFLESRTCGFSFTDNDRQDPESVEIERAKWIARKARAQTSHGKKSKSTHERLFGTKAFRSSIVGHRWKIEKRNFDIVSGCPS